MPPHQNANGLPTPSPIEECRLCGHPFLHELLSLGSMAHTSVFPARPGDPVTEGPLILVRCDSCGLVQLDRNYDRAEIDAGNYGYRSGLNQSMVRHLKDISRLAMTLKPDAKSVLDIGANDATLLKHFPDQLWKGAYEPNFLQFESYYPPNVTIWPTYFNGQADKVDIVTSIAMLYDLEDVRGFARAVAGTLNDGGIWVTEQAYLPSMLKHTAYDSICHEHLEYYGLEQLDRMAADAGLQILYSEATQTNGGSMIVVFEKGTQRLDGYAVERERELTSADAFSHFTYRINMSRTRLLRELAAFKVVHALGASTKGNVILQYCRPPITHIAEINEDKIGRYTPGTHIPIISEAESEAMAPDAYVVLPWHFKQGMLERYPSHNLIFPL